MTKKENNSNRLEQQEDSFYKLSIQVSLNGLSFCILDTIGKRLALSHSLRFNQELSPYDLQRELRESLRVNGVLEYRFSEVVAIHRNALFSLVPQALFSRDDLANYLKFNAKILPTDHLDYDSIDGLDAVNVYVPFANVNNYLYDLFGEFEFKHTATVLLETLVKLPANGTGEICYVHLAEGQMDMTVFSGKKMQYFNSFSVGTGEDIMYYLLFAIEQLGLDPATIKLRFLGEIEAGDATYDLAARYIENISIFVPSGEPYASVGSEEDIDFTLINSL
ncbi:MULTISPECIES: DUF3822 family protein [unclassified Robiginitalea]|uniref:DUF3822 family protein n=1 Tax=Robiginitalea TaxID=252306 RepID=UPI00234BBB78|nr:MULTISPECIES: DUF3822 family protein [unclassified Robiginitalea]MDC6353722.1 DUF3822 family protein [Robiginitalea sp. PM2]MDC6375796.1 DUF3822 family protein [Robiginitalea sp. SP8]